MQKWLQRWRRPRPAPGEPAELGPEQWFQIGPIKADQFVQGRSLALGGRRVGAWFGGEGVAGVSAGGRRLYAIEEIDIPWDDPESGEATGAARLLLFDLDTLSVAILDRRGRFKPISIDPSQAEADGGAVIRYDKVVFGLRSVHPLRRTLAEITDWGAINWA